MHLGYDLEHYPKENKIQILTKPMVQLIDHNLQIYSRADQSGQRTMGLNGMADKIQK